ncbi:hypothetical protein BBJ28_00002768 [Nothophytophthora sp. Chile5]|nr:hypothetical protein BBJ28_00002768 [Nothophytophthora sp. Chile5]
MDAVHILIRETQLISNRKEITEDEHGGETATGGDFFNRERMDPRKGYETQRALDIDFDAFFSPFQQRYASLANWMLAVWHSPNLTHGGSLCISGDDFEAQMSPFDFLRQEMLRPFEDFFGGGFLGGRDSNMFEGLDGEMERMPVRPPSPSPRRPSGQTPSNPPHYSFQPSQGKRSNGKSRYSRASPKALCALLHRVNADKLMTHGSESDAKAREAQRKKDMFADYSGRVEEI